MKSRRFIAILLMLSILLSLALPVAASAAASPVAEVEILPLDGGVIYMRSSASQTTVVTASSSSDQVEINFSLTSSPSTVYQFYITHSGPLSLSDANSSD